MVNRLKSTSGKVVGVCVASLALMLLSQSPCFATGFSLGDAANYAVLAQTTPNSSVTISNSSKISGNVGIGADRLLNIDSSSYIGNAVFAGVVFEANGNTGIHGSVSYGNSQVANDLTYLTNLSQGLASSKGNEIDFSNNQTIQAGKVYNVTPNSTSVGNLTIKGTSSDYVVLNFSTNVTFNGTITLTGGISANQVLFNITGNNALTIASANVEGVFLDPNGAISMTNSVLTGSLFGGDSSDLTISGSTINGPSSDSVAAAASIHNPEPAAIVLVGTGLGFLGICAVVRRRKSRAPVPPQAA